MMRRIARLVRCAIVSVALGAGLFYAAGATARTSSRLAELAAAQFPNLTRAERALLEHADVKNVGRGKFAVCGKSANPDDPSNDPKSAAEWDAQREIRAGLIRWLSVDPDAVKLVDPQGARLLGARITGTLDLTNVHVPFAISLRNCAIAEPMELSSAELPALALSGSHTGSIHAFGIIVNSTLALDQGFHATGWVNLQEARLGELLAGDGQFRYAPDSSNYFAPYRNVLNLTYADIRGSVYLVDGFEADGGVGLFQAKIAGDLGCDSGHFFNPGNLALDATSSSVVGNVIIASAEAQKNDVPKGGFVKFDGLARFDSARIEGLFFADQVMFGGKRGETHGLSAASTAIRGPFIWREVEMENGAQLNLSGASLSGIVDEERSWPAPGNLSIDGLTYSGFGMQAASDAPGDAQTRLRWLSLQPAGYHPQPYRQLAKVLREAGDDGGAVKVMIAGGDARYAQYGSAGRIVGWLLKVTIGYGHRPLLTTGWMLAIVLFGWATVSAAARAGLMRPTWPESVPPGTPAQSYERLHPLLYSADVFFPFVNFHQEQYWWPDAGRTAEFSLLGLKAKLNGSIVRYYLWLQIAAGWLLSAIFVAGVTGLIRSE